MDMSGTTLTMNYSNTFPVLRLDCISTMARWFAPNPPVALSVEYVITARKSYLRGRLYKIPFIAIGDPLVEHT